MSAYGKAAYEAYRESFAETHPEYREWFSSHEWDAMEQVQREAWQQAAAAVLRLDSQQHKSARAPERETFKTGDTV